MAKIVAMGQAGLANRPILWVSVDGREQPVLYQNGEPTYIELTDGMHEIVASTVSRYSKDGYALENAVTETYSVELVGEAVLFLYVKQGKSPSIFARMTNTDALASVYAELQQDLSASKSNTESTGALIGWTLLGFLPFAGIGLGIYHLCRAKKRVTVGVVSLVLSLATTALLVYLLAQGGSRKPEDPRPVEASDPYTESYDEASDWEVSDEPYEETEEPATEVSEEPTTRILYIDADGRLNLREAPSVDSKSIILMENHESVLVYQIEDGWAYVEYRGMVGWCSAEFLTDNPYWESYETEPYTYMYVNAEGRLRMRAEPSETARQIDLIPNQTRVKVYSIENGWAYIEYNKKLGWCSAEFLTSEPS